MLSHQLHNDNESLRRKSQTLHHSLEAGMIPQRIEPGKYFEVDYERIAREDCAIELGERCLRVT